MIAMLVDVTHCIGCNQCVDACVQTNHLGEETPKTQHVQDGLSANRWTTVLDGPKGRQIRKFCQHCLDPACVSVCPVGAMYKTPAGPVLYDSTICMGCRDCMMACPFGIPRYQWDNTVPLVRKCIFCNSLLQAGDIPACLNACPQDVHTFGERSELLEIAKQRIADNPGSYINEVFGEFEVGGTSILYLSDVPLDLLSFDGKSREEPLPELTWNWISKVPGVALGMGLATGLFWVIERRMAADRAREQKSQEGEPDANE